MGTDDVLTEDDRALLAHLEDDVDAAEDASELEAIARDLRDQLRKQRNELCRLKREFQSF
jgi:hypothetical protein